jgi:ACR3 family arsenite efflux pump ArsB
VLVGVLFVLLAPCVDYVIVFAGLAGGSRERLLAATPLLMLAQLLLLPVFLWWMAGSDIAATVEARPFVEALLWLIVLPLAAAAGTQFAAERARWVARLRDAVLGAMVPLMMLTLAVVVASQVAGIGGRIATLVIAMPVFVLFAAVMVAAGAAVSRLVGLDTAGRRAVVFSGATRNSLVVLPLVLALPPAFALAPLVVVAQTLVELVVMVALVRLMPRLIPG